MSAAAEKLEQTRRGWTTEEDKKIKIFNLPKVNKAFDNNFDFFKNCYGTDEWTSGMEYSLCYCLSKFNCELRNESWNNESCKDCRFVFLQMNSLSPIKRLIRFMRRDQLTNHW